MDITKSREAFEAAFAKKRGLSIENVISMQHGDDYWNDNHLAAGIGIAWIFWKLSRESIEVELPEKVFEECEFDRGHNFGIDYCIISLEEAGIRIKGNEKS
ncbi:hypothetical protein [Yersinia kristensenii]|uniref:hypothetical protein n=1 Tax=Yersinia kristensenii TaxID=28152 RepID=UPI001FE82B87|nr:hypothetical protein [Yersinia kristensenii]